ncbi:uncharacterized protein LOC143153267 [Ptiloglossa arizonensis]|uniref:uncharacterized protein LOC143153267 n=1 Tax=Ptiloglossa arizonensis TaxID=3350558 RepID=UPI003F9EC7D4
MSVEFPDPDSRDLFSSPDNGTRFPVRWSNRTYFISVKRQNDSGQIPWLVGELVKRYIPEGDSTTEKGARNVRQVINRRSTVERGTFVRAPRSSKVRLFRV